MKSFWKKLMWSVDVNSTPVNSVTTTMEKLGSVSLALTLKLLDLATKMVYH